MAKNTFVAEVTFKSLLQKKMKFPIRDFSRKCNKISSFLQICYHLLKSLMKKFIFWAVIIPHNRNSMKTTLTQCMNNFADRNSKLVYQNGPSLMSKNFHLDFLEENSSRFS